MKTSQIAAQLYSVRNFLRTPRDVAASLEKIRAIGYQAVQLSGLCAMDEAELVAMLRDNNLVCCATHEDSETILDKPLRVVEKLKKLGCRITAYPWPANVKFDTLPEVTLFAHRLNDAGKVLYEAGQVLCYHNHHLEFRRVGGLPALEIIFAETDPRYLQGEPDTYWVQYGGGDPVDWCARLNGRMPIIHLKDYAIGPDNKPVFAEIGNGNLDWRSIVPAAEAAGCQWFCVEQDDCPGDPFESLKMSFDYLRAHLCSD